MTVFLIADDFLWPNCRRLASYAKDRRTQRRIGDTVTIFILFIRKETKKCFLKGVIYELCAKCYKNFHILIVVLIYSLAFKINSLTSLIISKGIISIEGYFLRKGILPIRITEQAIYIRHFLHSLRKVIFHMIHESSF